MRYEDMTIELSAFSTRTENGRSLDTFKVRVVQSPAGEMEADRATTVEYDTRDLQRTLDKLDRRELDRDGVIGLGRTLAALLLPIKGEGGAPSVRELFSRSLAKLAADDGLRLRLRLPGELSVLPWEYAYVERAGGEGMDGFLALDPRVAIVRHEVLGAAVNPPLMEGDVKVVTALASAEGLPELDLDEEKQILVAALKGVSGLRIEPYPHATFGNLQQMLTGAGIFHFAGHGDFTRQMGARPGTYTGAGFLAFEDQRVAAEQLGINLRGNGIRLTVLGGCSTGRRDGVSVWSGIAPALVRAEIPAVVANQYTILDTCAIAFSAGFYQGLAGGMPIERAVTAGRIAAYNADRDGRDWGVPVLYLRAASGQLFAGAADRAARERARKAAEADVNVRATQIKGGGVLVGADVRRMVEGKLAVAVKVEGAVLGQVTGSRFDRVDGGSINTQVDVGEVGSGGSVIGTRIGTVGAEPVSPRRRRGGGAPRETAPPPAPSPPAGPPPAPPAPAPAPGATRTPPTRRSRTRGVNTEVDVEKVTGGGQVFGAVSGRNITIYQGGGQPAPSDHEEKQIEEAIRLDGALPTTAVVNEVFRLVVAVRRPDSPPLAVADLDQEVSAAGSIVYRETQEFVKYRIEVTGDGFQVSPPSYLLKLRPGRDSRQVEFEVSSSRTGKRSLLISAYQEDDTLAAQTRLTLEVTVAVQPA